MSLKRLGLLLTIVFSVTATSLNATHIIGGYISYTSLPNNEYEVHLVVYRDCFYGVPPFDDPALLAVFDSSNNLFTTVDISPADSQGVFLPAACVPSNICIRKANYYATITLPPNSGTYTLAYQRCCRSSLVLNLVDPLNAGMAFTNTINTGIQNNTPDYNHEFAAFTFQGVNFSFDASAVDSDGDSLVYMLEDALNGASQGNAVLFSTTVASFPPPFLHIPWQAPYSKTDMLGGAVPLTIDPNSGVLTAIPGFNGVFEICYRVEEYRNGVLINTNRREFVLSISQPMYFDIPGNVTANLNTVPLDAGKSWLVLLNLLDSTLTALDTNAVVNGSYLHPQALGGKYLVKASADPSSQYYSNNMPTYFGDELYWYDATFVDACMTIFPSVDIHLVRGMNPGGPGFIGGLISQGANRLMYMPQQQDNFTVILTDSTGQPVAWAPVDATGTLAIGNLPAGSYRVNVDKLGYYIDNNLAPVISVTASNPVLNNLSFILHNTWLELVGFVGENETSPQDEAISVYPNPFTKKVDIAIPDPGTGKLRIEIRDLPGKIIYQEEIISQPGMIKESIDFSDHTTKSGIYILSVFDSFSVRSTKLIYLGEH